MYVSWLKVEGLKVPLSRGSNMGKAGKYDPAHLVSLSRFWRTLPLRLRTSRAPQQHQWSSRKKRALFVVRMVAW